MPDPAPSPNDVEEDVLKFFHFQTNGFAPDVKKEAACAVRRRFAAMINAWNDPSAHLRALIRDLRQSATDYSAVLEILILQFLIVKIPMNDLLNYLHAKGVHVSEKAKGNKSVPKDASPAERLRPSINTKLNRMSADGLIEIDSSLGARHRILQSTKEGIERLNLLLLNPSQANKAYLVAAGVLTEPAPPGARKRAKS